MRLDPFVRRRQALRRVGRSLVLVLVLVGEGEEVRKDWVTADLEFVRCSAGRELVGG
jgi:hypothetical protein